MPTTILLIHRQLAFAVSVKQALERTGTFEVHPFTVLDSATEYLVAHPQDLAIVDFEMPSASGDEITLLLRDTQADIPIIATPLTPDSVLTALKLQGSVEARFTAREIIPLIEKIMATRKPGTVALSQDPELGRSGLLTRVIEQKKTDVLPKTRPQPGEVEMPPRIPSEDDYDPYFEDRPEIDVDVSALFSEEEAPESASVDPSSLFADFEQWAEPEIEDDLFDDLSDEPAFGQNLDDDFDNVLTAIEGTPEPDDRPRDKFDNLVDSMRADEERKPLPARQQFIEFTLASGMDSLVEQIERKRTTEIPQVNLPHDDVSAQLAADEPPPPSFEDSGTVGDLITGVNDSGFQNVLSILRGEEVAEEPDEAPTLDDLRADFDDDSFLSAIETDLGIVRPASLPGERVEFDFDSLEAVDNEPGESTPARFILEKAEDTSPDSDSFSINDLLDSIEKELPEYRPKIQAPPSWLSEEDADIQDLLASIAADNAVETGAPDTLPEIPATSVAASAAIQPDEPDTTGFDDVFDEVAEDEFDFDALLAEAEDSDDYYDQTTIPSRAQQIPQPEDLSDLETEMYEVADEEVEPELYPADWGLPEEPTLIEESAALIEDAEDEAQAVEDAAVTVDALAWADEDDDAPSRIPELDTSWDEATIAPEAAQLPAETVAKPAIMTEPPRIPGYDTEFERMATFAFVPVGDEPPPLETTHIDDPYIAQLALSLTDVSLELTADATLLTRDGEIAAYAGRMPREEMTELREVLGDDWDAKEDVSRIRFVNLPASGKDYMVYSRRTVDDLTLTLIFAGETQLRDIRQQGKRLVAALKAIPEVPADLQAIEAAQQSMDGIGTAVSDGVASTAIIEDNILRNPFAYVWILRDSSGHMPRQTAQAIVSGMNVQLREQVWRVRELRAADEYVYLLADVPGDTPPNQVIRELKRRSAQIASAQNKSLDSDHLWADSYLVVTPGRSLDMDEIQQFINFERML